MVTSVLFPNSKYETNQILGQSEPSCSQDLIALANKSNRQVQFCEVQKKNVWVVLSVGLVLME